MKQGHRALIPFFVLIQVLQHEVTVNGFHLSPEITANDRDPHPVSHFFR